MWILCSHGEGLGERIRDQFVFHLVNWGWSHHNIFKMWGTQLPILWPQLIFHLYYLLFPTCPLYTFALGNVLCFATTNFLFILFLIHIFHSISKTFFIHVSSIKCLLIITKAATTLTFTTYTSHKLSVF